MKLDNRLNHSLDLRGEFVLESEWKLVLYILLTVFGFCFASSGISVSDFSEFPSNDKTFVVQGAPLDSDRVQGAVVNPTASTFQSYSYDKVVPFKRFVALERVDELSRSDFKNIILTSTPHSLRKRLVRYIDHALKYSEKHNVDPFWVISVMWTESHFKNSARSYVNARGLMQIMPATGHEISTKLKFTKTKKQTRRLLRRPRYNIEMGAYYLNKLMKGLWHNPILATVAYNMGPNWVKRRIKKRMRVGNRNKYLDKVTKAYFRLTRNYVAYTKTTPRPFTKTFVAINRIAPNKHSNLLALDEISFL
ncbi:MAG: lytic transglycosylase domain-containing protein [Bacteriovoracaceae bacterium]|nr:lytic transglycosylase domain-containing protein [Bacteriovoracaceae bacterium]